MTIQDLLNWCGRHNIPFTVKLMVYDYVEGNDTFAVVDEKGSSRDGVVLVIDESSKHQATMRS